MSPVLLLVLVLALYSIFGAALALNIGSVSERFTALYRSLPTAVRPFRHWEPIEWRAWGLVMFVFGGIVLIWIALDAMGVRPQLSHAVAAPLLIGIAVAGIVAAAILRLRRRS